jgi:hypothetical protein
MSERFGKFKFLGSVEILKSLSKESYSKQSSVIRFAIQKVINDKISEEAGSTLGSDFSPGPRHPDFIGQTILGHPGPVEITIESNMLRTFQVSSEVSSEVNSEVSSEIRHSHHFNTISISMCDNTISNIFCYLANSNIKTRNQKFETVGQANRHLYIFQCENTDQARAMARAMDVRFKPRNYNQNTCRSYLTPVGPEKVRIPQEALVSVRH